MERDPESRSMKLEFSQAVVGLGLTAMLPAKHEDQTWQRNFR